MCEEDRGVSPRGLSGLCGWYRSVRQRVRSCVAIRVGEPSWRAEGRKPSGPPPHPGAYAPRLARTAAPRLARNPTQPARSLLRGVVLGPAERNRRLLRPGPVLDVGHVTALPVDRGRAGAAADEDDVPLAGVRPGFGDRLDQVTLLELRL